MKRLASLALILIFALCALSGCMAPAAAEAEPTAAPTPEPEGIRRVFGVETATVGIWGGSEEFVQAAMYQAEIMGMTAATVTSEEEADACDTVVIYRPEDKPGVSVPSVVFTDDAAKTPTDGRAIIADPDAPLKAAMDALIRYESHCTPIRTVAIVATDDGPAAQLVEQERASGMLMLKGVQVGVDEQAIAELFDSITVGLLDTVFAENEELALMAYDALMANYRNDLVEVITPALSMEIVSRMAEDHYLMGAAAGVDERSAGALAVRMAAALFAGREVEDVTMKPIVVYSKDIYKLEGEDAIREYISALDTETGKLYVTEDTAYLTDYYGDR